MRATVRDVRAWLDNLPGEDTPVLACLGGIRAGGDSISQLDMSDPDGPALTVCVGIITHRHDSDLYAGKDEATLYAKLADYCRQWWDEACRDRHPSPEEEPACSAPPGDDKKCVDEYFSKHPTESLELHLNEDI